jgi:hypothetical protein
VANTGTDNAVGLVAIAIATLVLGAVVVIVAPSSASDTPSYEGTTAGQSGPTPMEARPLARTNMFMV